MSKFGFLELAHKILQEENKPLSVEEMWQLAIQKGYDTLLGSNGKTPERTLGGRVFMWICKVMWIVFFQRQVRGLLALV